MVIIGADHAGFELKNNIINYLKETDTKYMDVTNYNIDNTDDYPDIAENICKEVKKDNKNLGIAICGTGIGISIACNKIKGIIAGTSHNEYTAKMLKEHNNANVICFGGRLDYSKDLKLINSMVSIFLTSKFDEGRHLRRTCKISSLEEKFGEI